MICEKCGCDMPVYEEKDGRAVYICVNPECADYDDRMESAK